MAPNKPIHDLINVANQLEDLDTRGLTSGIQNPGAAPGASLRATSSPSDVPKPTTTQSPAANLSPTELRTRALLKQVLVRVESHIITLLDSTNDTISEREVQLFLSILLTQRSTVLGYLTETPADVSLRDSLLEFTEFVEETVAALQPGSRAALERVATSLRERYATLALFGVSSPPLKQEITALQKTIAGESSVGHTDLIDKLHHCLTAFQRLEDKAGAAPKSSLLYGLLQ